MNPFKQMELHKQEFTKTDLQIYRLIQKNPYTFTTASGNITNKFNVSQAALTRFAQKIGYQGFNDLKYDLTKYELSNHETDISPYDYYKLLIEAIEKKVTADIYTDLVHDIQNANTIYLTGFQRSMLPAKQLDFNLKEFGYNSQFLSDYELCRMRSFIKPKDLIINFSVSGNNGYAYFLEAKEPLKQAKVVLITSSTKGQLSKLADKIILLPTEETEKFPVRLDTRISAMIFVSLLNNYLYLDNEE